MSETLRKLQKQPLKTKRQNRKKRGARGYFSFRTGSFERTRKVCNQWITAKNRIFGCKKQNLTSGQCSGMQVLGINRNKRDHRAKWRDHRSCYYYYVYDSKTTLTSLIEIAPHQANPWKRERKSQQNRRLLATTRKKVERQDGRSTETISHTQSSTVPKVQADLLSAS